MAGLNILCLCDMDGTLLLPGGRLSSFAKQTLNRALDKGRSIAIATARTPATLKPLVDGVRFRLPAACMNGAAFYDLRTGKYIKRLEMESREVGLIWNEFVRRGKNVFVHMITPENTLNIYHSRFSNSAEREFYNQRIHLPLKNYILSPPPPGRNAIYLTAIDRLEALLPIKRKVEKIPSVRVCCYRDIYNEGYYFLEIYNKKASKAAALKELAALCNADHTIAFGDNDNDLPMFLEADEAYAVLNATQNCKQAADHIIGSNAQDAVAKEIAKIYGENERCKDIMHG